MVPADTCGKDHVATSATRVFPNIRIWSADTGLEDRLVSLFRNRAALKKSYRDLKSEHHVLQEKLENSRAATRRAEERLESIERLMAKPEAGYNGLVYFQLRALWRACNDQMKLFVGELKGQQTDRERKKQIKRFQKDRDRRLGDLNDLIRRVKLESDRLADEIIHLEQERARMASIWHFFKRRDISSNLLAKSNEHAAVRQRIEELFDRRIKIEGEAWPEFPGLGVAGRRAINIAAAAFAHHLYEYCSEGGIAVLARDAVTRPIQDLTYGSEDQCTHLIRTIQSLMDGLADRRDSAKDVKGLASEIRRHARFRSDDETVPLATSIDEAVLEPRNGRFNSARVNVLQDEYWDVYDVVLR